MSRITVWFIRCAIIYFLAAMIIGIIMTIKGGVYPLRPIHTHLNMLGWMSMMIYGVGYHILPRFSGVPLWSDKLAVAHIFTANIGLLGMIAGWTFKETVGYGMLHGFAMIEGLSVIFFALNMFKTIRAVSPPPKKA
ncbi:MAG: cbb3-type cytochrome c oxidase subunit I [Deltaproteobacteria bacterium]|nr:cbb3-type cytochrome c oxidase subunit I [Deltaproteobacteria bacterium]